MNKCIEAFLYYGGMSAVVHLDGIVIGGKLFKSLLLEV